MIRSYCPKTELRKLSYRNMYTRLGFWVIVRDENMNDMKQRISLGQHRAVRIDLFSLQDTSCQVDMVLMPWVIATDVALGHSQMQKHDTTNIPRWISSCLEASLCEKSYRLWHSHLKIAMMTRAIPRWDSYLTSRFTPIWSPLRWLQGFPGEDCHGVEKPLCMIPPGIMHVIVWYLQAGHE